MPESQKAYIGHSSRLPEAIGFRPIIDNDLPFLSQLYASTRADEMAMVPWSEEEKAAFLQMQFNAQHSYYQQQFNDADFLIIYKNEESIGRVYVERRADEIRLIDIALKPEQRGLGLGTLLLEELLNEAKESQLPVRIHVEQFNPALKLYQRLGFKQTEDQGVYFLMEWCPNEDKAEPQVKTAS